jgi:peptidoglycan/LPS O-acetylase OafA/YrhL
MRLAVAMPIAFGLAWIAYQLIERPMIRLGRKLEVSLGVAQPGVANAAEDRTERLPTKTV